MVENKFKDMDIVDLVIELESGMSTIDNYDEARTVLEKIAPLRHSQGFYSSMYEVLTLALEGEED